LRAIAVLAVLAYHTRTGRAAGGYLGVDIFFVISGYLISSIILREIAAGSFSIKRFYERRIRRIYPALMFMLAVVTAGALVGLLPADLIAYAKALIAAVFFSANFYFLKNSSYFGSAGNSPLLHTWSLAVEEQFYILFPLFLMAAARWMRDRLRTAVAVLFVISLVLSIIVVHVHQELAFYMLPTRAWELMLGTLVSQGIFPKLKNAWLRNAIALLGAALILGSFLTYTEGTLFPGESALLPCIGTALIIGCGEEGPSLVNSILSLRPLVFVGLISYSLYLWHFPVMIFQKKGLLLTKSQVLPGSMMPPNHFNIYAEFPLIFLLAVLSWQFVEKPFRFGRLNIKANFLFLATGAVMAVLTLVAGITLANGGFAQRFSPESLAIANAASLQQNESKQRLGGCMIDPRQNFADFHPEECLDVDGVKKNYLILGDSHAAMFYPAFAAVFPQFNFLQANVTNCAPFVHTYGTKVCHQMMDFIFDEWIPRHKIDAVFLVRHWQPRDYPYIQQTSDWARRSGVHLVVLGPTPSYDAPLPELEARALAWRRPQLVQEHLVVSDMQLDQQMRDHAVSQWKVPYVSLYEAACDRGECLEFTDAEHRVPAMFDGEHLTYEAASIVLKRLIALNDYGLLFN
jgi:peptidoglycan/LPS O-acetylase OafA/YrhL